LVAGCIDIHAMLGEIETMLKVRKRGTVEGAQNKQAKDNQNFVLYVPEIKHNDWQIVGGKVLLNFKVTNPITRFLGLLVKKEPIRDMLFDDKCSCAWHLIDGERTIYEIAKAQSKENHDKFEEDLRSLVMFIKYISKKGWIRYKRVKKREEIF